MTTQVQKRRGTTTEHSTFTGAEGEITVDTTKDTAVVHDGVSAGGKPLAREDLNNVSASTVAAKLNGTAITGVDINSGAIDSTTVGATTPAAGTFTALTATGTTTLAGATTSADINFGDNDKAIFGAGSDLQIYHSGSDSYISDTGQGALYLTGSSSVNIGNQPLSEWMLRALENSAVELYYDGAKKLATTSTGIDVTGTATMDGLTVDGVGIFSSSSPNIRLDETDTTDLNTRFRAQGGVLKLETTTDAAGLVGTRLEVDHATGDIRFYEDTGSSPKLTWDASTEQLQLTGSGGLSVNSGATNVAAELESTDAIVFLNMRDNVTTQDVQYGASGDDAIIRTDLKERVNIAGNGDISFYEDTGTTAKFFWDASAERLGIGTSSPSEKLSVSAGNMTLDSSYALQWGLGNERITAVTSGNSLRFVTNNSEAMRIDSSGNLLVGKTSANTYTTAGSELLGSGLARHTRSGGSVLSLTRLTSDGSIIDFQKDAATVGSIGTYSGLTAINSGTNNRGLLFGDTVVRPQTSNGTNLDNTLDLGTSSSRFKDLYLSGGVYLGGTGSANHLDDYETGTWIPEIADASSGGNTGTFALTRAIYTKVGDLVTVSTTMTNLDTTGMTGGNDLHIRGLPFSVSSSEYAIGSCITDNVTFGGAFVAPIAFASTSHLNLRQTTSGTSDVILDVSAISSGVSDIIITITYRAA